MDPKCSVLSGRPSNCTLGVHIEGALETAGPESRSVASGLGKPEWAFWGWQGRPRLAWLCHALAGIHGSAPGAGVFLSVPHLNVPD